MESQSFDSLLNAFSVFTAAQAPKIQNVSDRKLPVRVRILNSLRKVFLHLSLTVDMLLFTIITPL
jgi:hypothetical protein